MRMEVEILTTVENLTNQLREVVVLAATILPHSVTIVVDIQVITMRLIRHQAGQGILLPPQDKEDVLTIITKIMNTSNPPVIAMLIHTLTPRQFIPDSTSKRHQVTLTGVQIMVEIHPLLEDTFMEDILHLIITFHILEMVNLIHLPRMVMVDKIRHLIHQMVTLV